MSYIGIPPQGIPPRRCTEGARFMKHKRFFCLLCVLILCFSALSPAFAEQSEDAGSGDGATPTNWMSYLYDNLYLNRINIPGTHDSGTKYVDAGQCQNIPINEQLDMGVRFLDMRVGVMWRNVDGRKQHYLQIYHGDFNANLSFDQVVDWCSSFLKAHPTEFIVMSVKEDPDPQRGSEYNTAQMMEQYIAKYNAKHPGLFHTTNKYIPWVGEARGKIILMRRYNNGNCEPIGIDARSNWPNDSYGIYENAEFYDEGGLPIDVRLAVQDCYSFGSGGSGCEAEKWYCWRKWRGKAEEDERPGSKWAGKTLWINFGSGCNKLGLAIEAIANYVNPRIKSSFDNLYNSGDIRGIIPMDFVRSDVVQAIYNSNILVRTEQPPPSAYGISETVDGKHDGKLRLAEGYYNTGRIQYRLIGLNKSRLWLDWPADASEISNLVPGVYDLRNKATNNYKESPTVQVVVGPGSAQTYLVAVTKIAPSPASGVPFGPLTYRYATTNSVKYTLTNVGNSKVENLSVWCTGDSEFQIVTENVPPISKTLNVGESTTVTVSFATLCDAKQYSSALQYRCSGSADSAVPLANLLQTVKPFDLELDNAEISDIDSQQYTGHPIEPRLTVTVPANALHQQYTLIASDFTALYADNTKVGTAYAGAHGKGSFTGVLTTDFEITGSKLTFDANGGLIEGDATKILLNRSSVPTLTDYVPYRSGHAFAGWFYKDTSTEAHTNDEILDDTELYAKWIDGDFILSVDPGKWAFDSAESGYTDPPEAKTFKLKNIGSGTITGFSVRGATDDYTISYESVPIESNKEVAFTVRPKTGLNEGVHTDTLTVFTADSLSPALTLSVAFTVTPSTLVLYPDELDFGATAPGYPAPPAAQTFHVAYTGKSDKSVNITSISGADDFVKSSISSSTLTADHPTATFTVQPKTGLNEGVYHETVTVTGTVNSTSNSGLLASIQNLLAGANNTVSATAQVQFTVSSGICAPEITQQPSDTTVPAGSSATFTVAATGNPTPFYQWQTRAKSGDPWTDLFCTDPSLTTDPLLPAQHGTQFRCRVWNYTTQENVVFSEFATAAVNSLRITPAGQFVVGNAPGNLTLHIGEDGQNPSTGDWGSLAIVLDGESTAAPVDPKHFNVTYGSIHLALHQDWLNVLPSGKHQLQVTLTGNYAGTPVLTIPLIVTAPGGDGNVPATGDSAQPWLWLGMMLLSAAGLIAAVASRRRRQRNRQKHCFLITG